MVSHEKNWRNPLLHTNWTCREKNNVKLMFITHNCFKWAHWEKFAQHGKLKCYVEGLKHAKLKRLLQYIFVASTQAQTRGVRSLEGLGWRMEHYSLCYWVLATSNMLLNCHFHTELQKVRLCSVCTFMNGGICVAINVSVTCHLLAGMSQNVKAYLLVLWLQGRIRAYC